MNAVIALKRLRAEQPEPEAPSRAAKDTPEFKAGYRIGWRTGVTESIEVIEETDCACAEGLMDSEEDY